MKRLLAIILAFAMLLSMAVVVSAAESEVVDIEISKTNYIVSGAYADKNDTETFTWGDGTVTVNDVELIGFDMDAMDLSNGKTVTVIIKGSSEGQFRLWLSGGNGDANSNQWKSAENGFTSGDFEYVAELTATVDDNTTLAIKAPSSGEKLVNFTLTSIQAFQGTKAQYEEYLASSGNGDSGNVTYETQTVWTANGLPHESEGGYHVILEGSATTGLYEALSKEDAMIYIQTTLESDPGWGQIQLEHGAEYQISATRTANEEGLLFSLDGASLLASITGTTVPRVILNTGSATEVTAVYVTATVAVEDEGGDTPTTTIEVTETVTGSFEVTFTDETTYGSDSKLNTEALDGVTAIDNQWVNILPLITSQIADIDLSAITNIDVDVSSSAYTYWQRKTESASEAIGADKMISSELQLNGANVNTDYWMNSAKTYSITEDKLTGSISSISFKVFNGKPNTTVTITLSLDVTYTKEVAVDNTVVLGGTGYIATGETTHAVIINGAIITTEHVFNPNGDCVYCRYHVDPVVEEDDVVVEEPVESDTEETEDVVVEEPVEDTNPGTGIALAVVPMVVALAAVVISKR